MKAAFHTLGCKLNFAETATIAKMLAAHGIERAAEGDEPDLIVVNTCSVTGLADHKCRAAIRRLNRRHPEAAIIVTGCYAQLCPDLLITLPGVVLVAGNDRKDRIADYIDRWTQTPLRSIEVTPTSEIRRFIPAGDNGERTRYFLKVQDGCDYWCSYCTIPRARGRSRSPRIAELLEQAASAARDGAREIVLTGVNIGDFGRGTSETFLDLIRALDSHQTGIDRFRISSIEPNLLTPEIIEHVAGSTRFMPHFHIPLQAGSDAVLSLMRRRYDTRLFAERIALVRRLIPDAFIGVDLIAGSRGESEEFFKQSLDFCRGLDISRLHVFPYSQRAGTAALRIPLSVSPEEKLRRTRLMLDLSLEKERAFSERFLGDVRHVLFETADGAGFSDNYLRVHCHNARNRVNEILPVRLTAVGADGTSVQGELLEN